MATRVWDLADRGRQITAAEFANDICGGAIARKKVIELFAKDVGYRPGRAWIFFENEARAAWDRYLETVKGGRREHRQKN